MKRKLLSLLLVVVMILSVVGCGSKSALTTSEFKEKMEGMEYMVVDCTEQYAGYDYIKACYIAAKDETAEYQIEWYELKDTDTAYSFYKNQKEIFEESAGSVSSNSSISGTNNDKYTLNSNNTYKLLSRIDNTVIYVDCDEDYKDVVKEVLKTLNY